MKIKTYRRLQMVCTLAFVAVLMSLTDWRHWEWGVLLMLWVFDAMLNYGEGMERCMEICRELEKNKE